MSDDKSKRWKLEVSFLMRLLIAGLFFVIVGTISCFVGISLVAIEVVAAGVLLSIFAVYIVRKFGKYPIEELSVGMIFRIGLPIGFVMFKYLTAADTQPVNIFFGEVVVVYLISLPLGVWLVRP